MNDSTSTAIRLSYIRKLLVSCLVLFFIVPLNDLQAGEKQGGASCDRNRECASGQCSGFGKNRKCTNVAGSLSGGARCKRNEECASGQCSGFGNNRTCTELGGTLQPNARCKRDRECSSGECSGLGSNRKCRTTSGQLRRGEGCERNKECQSGQCSGVGNNRQCTALGGQVQTGARCKRDDECKSGQCAGLGNNRKCRASAGELKQGSSCSRNKECQSGQCSGAGNKRRCTALGGQLQSGQRCKRDKECISGECAGFGSKRVCSNFRGGLLPGAGCERNKECKSGQCTGTGYNRKCTELTGQLVTGQACKRNKECRSGQCRGGRCTAVAGQLAHGARCAQNKECQSGQCTGTGKSRRCTAVTGVLARGVACKRNNECQSGQCWQGKCTAPTGQLPPGAACKQNKECKSGECFGAGKGRQCTAMTGSLPAGEPCLINKECMARKCDRIADLDEQFCEFGGMPCQDGQKKPPFPIRSSHTTQGVYVRWLGSAGFEVSIDNMRIIIDPFIARPWRHFNRGKTIKGAAIGNALSRKQLVEADPTLPHYLKYYDGINRADWIFVTHGHVDHSAEVGPLILNLAKQAKQHNGKLKLGLIGDRNMQWLMNGYEVKFGLNKLLGVEIDQRIVPFELGGSRWSYVPPEDPNERITTIDLGNGVSTTWYPGHHSQGAAATTGWSDRNPEAPAWWPLSIGSYHAHGIHNVLIEARGLRIMFMGSTEIHYGDPHVDPLPTEPVDVLVLAIPAWDTGNADRTLRILEVMKPGVVIPTHYDDYFWEWRDGCYIMEYANLPRFLREAPEFISDYKLATQIKLLDYGESHRVTDTPWHNKAKMRRQPLPYQRLRNKQ